MTQQERALIEFLASEPASDFAVVFARVAGRARGNHVLECVAAATRHWSDAVTL